LGATMKNLHILDTIGIAVLCVALARFGGFI
jgi:hypothetical protein